MTFETKLLELVDQMRAAQREYFKTRSPAAMDRAKKLEREVDRQLAARHEAAQPKLF